MNASVYGFYAPQYRERGLSAVPIEVGGKRPIGINGFNQYSREIIAEDRLKQLCKKYSNNGLGVVMGVEVKPGYKLMAVDVDDDRFVRFVAAVIGGFPCAKRGKKGLTGFVLASATQKNFKLYGHDKGKPVVELLGEGLQTVLPPTVHPETQQPYEWVGQSLLEVNFDDLPILTDSHIQLIQKVVASQHVEGVLSGEGTHAPMRDLCAQGLTQLEESDERLEEVLFALLPEGYRGDTNEELLGLIKSAREKRLGWRRDGYDPGKLGPQPMGYTDDSRYVFLDVRRQLKVMSSTLLTNRNGLMDMAPRTFWMEQFPRCSKEGVVLDFEPVVAGDKLMELCREMGPFVLSRVRGRGVWREGDKTVVNVGDTIPQSDAYTYVCFEPLKLVNADSEPEPIKVLELLRKFCWRNPQNADLLFGWLVLAPACGALEWRPHMFLHGPKNSGKTTLLHMVSHLLDPMVIKLDGQSSEAGIRQKLKADSLPVVLDEFESDGSASRMASIIRLARSASSGHDAVARGTPEGRALEFLIRATFLFGAINPRITTAADASRIVCVELVPHENSRETKQQIEALVREVRNFSPGWCHQAMRFVPYVAPTIAALKSAFPPMDSRHELNMATLLAGVWLGREGGRVPDETEAAAFAAEYETLLLEHAEAHEEDDSQMCLNHLLSYMIEGQPIALSLSAWRETSDASESAMRALRAHGLRVTKDGLYVANKSPGLDKIFANTRWADGAWVAALRRLPGAEARDAMYFTNKKSRATFIPLHNFNTEDRPREWQPMDSM